MLVLKFSTKYDGGIVFVFACRLHIGVKGVC